MHFRHYLHMQFSLQNCEHKNNIIIYLGITETHAYGSAQFHFSWKYRIARKTERSDNIETRNRFLHHNFYSGTLGTIFFKSGTAWCAFVIETPPGFLKVSSTTKHIFDKVNKVAVKRYDRNWRKYVSTFFCEQTLIWKTFELWIISRSLRSNI